MMTVSSRIWENGKVAMESEVLNVNKKEAMVVTCDEKLGSE